MYYDRAVRLISETGEVIEYLLPELGVSIRRAFVEDSTVPAT